MSQKRSVPHAHQSPRFLCEGGIARVRSLVLLILLTLLPRQARNPPDGNISRLRLQWIVSGFVGE